jgi:hypothetical protein
MAEKTDKTEKAVDTPAVEVQATPVAPRAAFDFTKLNTLAVVSLATAVTGFGAVAGVITGHIALKQIHTTKQSGRALALAGLITSYVFIGLGFAGFIASVALRARGIELGDHRMGQFGQHQMPPFGEMHGGMGFGPDDQMGGSQMQGGHMNGGEMPGGMHHMGGQMGWGDVDPGQSPVPTPATTN